VLRIGRFGVKIEDILHASDVFSIHPRNAPHFGEPAAHGIARDAVMVGEADHGVGRKIEGPTRAALGRA
jgi:hypothetical protein